MSRELDEGLVLKVAALVTCALNQNVANRSLARRITEGGANSPLWLDLPRQDRPCGYARAVAGFPHSPSEGFSPRNRRLYSCTRC